MQLEENGSFSRKCDGYEGEDEICPAQTAALLNVNLCAMLTQLTSPLLGWIVDKYSPRVAFYWMAALTWSGLALMIVAVDGSVDWLLYIAFSLLALNTWFGGLLSIQTGLYFQGHTRSRVIFALNSLFDAGAITYLGLWAINKLLDNLVLLLSLYLISAVIVYGLGVYFWTVAVPEESHEGVSIELSTAEKEEDPTNTTRNSTASSLNRRSEEPVSDHFESVHDRFETIAEEHAEEEVVDNNSDARDENSSLPLPQRNDVSNDEIIPSCFIPVNQRTQRQQMLSGPYIMLFVYFVLHVIGNQFNLATARDFLAYLGDDDYGNKYLTIFTLLTPASICGIPFVDRVLLRYGFHAGFQCVNMLALTYQVIKVSSDSLNVQVIGFVAFSFFRSFFFGMVFSFLPTLLSHDVVGKATGALFAGTAAFSFINIPLANLAVERFDGDFFVPNMVHTILVVPCVVVAWRLGQYLDKVKSTRESL